MMMMMSSLLACLLLWLFLPCLLLLWFVSLLLALYLLQPVLDLLLDYCHLNSTYSELSSKESQWLKSYPQLLVKLLLEQNSSSNNRDDLHAAVHSSMNRRLQTIPMTNHTICCTQIRNNVSNPFRKCIQTSRVRKCVETSHVRSYVSTNRASFQCPVADCIFLAF